jgi:O-antigen/teichoic acid export membrane protein
VPDAQAPIHDIEAVDGGHLVSAAPGPEGEATASYARGARILSIGIAATGVFTFGYFAVASHVLPSRQYGEISTLWAILFVTISVIYRPVEQLLSRSIAQRRARGMAGGHPLRTPALIQASFALLFLAVALALRPQIVDHAFGGSETLYWILVGSVLAYAASYFARGYLAGHQWFALYGGLVLFESVARFMFPVAVAVGVASGQTAVAFGILAAPFASLLVIPWALRRHVAADASEPAGDGAMRESAGFAVSVAAIQLAEQTLISIGVLLVPTAVVRGIVFNALLIARAPLQLFQAIQTSLLPHLTGIEAREGADGFDSTIRVTVMLIAAFTAIVALALAALGPQLMDIAFGKGYTYPRGGLVLVALGMGFHLTAGTLNQAALARGQASRAAAAWLVSGAIFVGWMVSPIVSGYLLRAETGYAFAAALLAAMLFVLYRRGGREAARIGELGGADPAQVA